MMELIEKASKVYEENFPMTTCFERAVFYSWACQLEECCKYCFMSTLPKEKRTNERVRSFGSLLAETVLCKRLGWDYGFLSGGIGVFDDQKVFDLIKKTYQIMGEKIWVNIGNLDHDQILRFKPYIKGVIGTVEVLDPKLHKEICPSKPIEPVEEMFDAAKKAGVDSGMTIIIGLGERIEDFPLLERFIEKNSINKIHIYGLNPQKGTMFEDSEPPSADYQAEWIAKTRIAFPKIDIQCGIWLDRVDRISILLKAGANSISKFPILKSFGRKETHEMVRQAEVAGREFLGNVTQIPDIDWGVEELPFDDELRRQIKLKLDSYLERMKKNCISR